MRPENAAAGGNRPEGEKPLAKPPEWTVPLIGLVLLAGWASLALAPEAGLGVLGAGLVADHALSWIHELVLAARDRAPAPPAADWRGPVERRA